MLEENLYKNPFSDYNANTMDSEQIIHFWENPFNKYLLDITEEEFASEKTPLFFTGGRGTGKTMLLKHFDISAEILRAEKEEKELKKYINDNGYIGLYIRFDSPLLKGFNGLGLDYEKWEVIFTHFFEMTIAKAFIDSLCKLEDKKVFNEDEKQVIINKIKEIIPIKVNSLKEISLWFKNGINYVNTFRSDIAFETIIFAPEKRFSSGELSKALVKIIKEACPILRKVNFLVLIDEYENFLEYEQKIVNSMIKFSNDISFRIGMRPMGFHTFATVSENEFIKETRDYRNVVLENPLIKKDPIKKEQIKVSGYIDFLLGIAEKRLKSVKLFNQNGLTDLRTFLGEKEDPISEANNIVKGRTLHIDVYLKEIKKLYAKQKKANFVITKKQLEKLRCPENPLFEMQNMRMLLKPFSIEYVIKAFTDYKSGIKSAEATKYRNDYTNKYKLAYVFVLRSIYRIENKQYYGVNDYAYLSSGIVGMFIELCRCAFQYAFFSSKDNLFKGVILPDIQTKAARDVGKSELEQVKRISKVGNYVYNLATNIGREFTEYHIDKRIKYPETNQISFNSSKLENHSFESDVFQAAVMWSVLQKKKDLQQAGIGKKDEEIYILNRIFAPIFNISARTRGGHNLELDVDKFKKFIEKEEIGENIKDDEEVNYIMPSLFDNINNLDEDNGE